MRGQAMGRVDPSKCQAGGCGWPDAESSGSLLGGAAVGLGAGSRRDIVARARGGYRDGLVTGVQVGDARQRAGPLPVLQGPQQAHTTPGSDHLGGAARRERSGPGALSPVRRAGLRAHYHHCIRDCCYCDCCFY